MDYPTLSSALESLPETLDATYARILKAIPAYHKPAALRLLQFLAFLERPLTIQEAIDAVAVNTDTSPHFSTKNRIPDPKEITRYCSSLVVMASVKKRTYRWEDEGQTKDTMELRLAHLSVKEYLISNRFDQSTAQMFQESTARTSIITVRLAYLLHFDRVPPLQEVEKQFPFAEYCATYWITHAQKANYENRELRCLIERLFCYPASPYRLCYLYFPEELPIGSDDFLRRPFLVSCWDRNPVPPPVYYAAYSGLTQLLEFLLNNNADINADGGRWSNALQAASVIGNTAGVKLLLDRGANVNIKDGECHGALCAASHEGHENVVRLLLIKSHDSTILMGAFQTALHKGHEAIAKLLFDKLIDAEMQCDQFDTAFELASGAGKEDMVKLLLNKNVDVNACGGRALRAASLHGRQHIVKLLLSNNADVNARGERALRVASFTGYKHIIELQLRNNANVNTHCGQGTTALQEASRGGNEAVVRLLLENKADVNAQSEIYCTALKIASWEGHTAIVELLLDNDANINLQYGNTGTALQAASFQGHKEVVQLLLRKGANVHLSCGNYGTALEAASRQGHPEIIEMLLKAGATPK